MPLVIPTASENKLLEFMLGKSVPGDQTLRLYVNNIAPSDTDVPATYTEMSTHGYVAKTLTKANWTVAQSGAVAEGTQPVQTWTFTAAVAVLVYGYFVIDSTTGLLVWSERFASAKSVALAGDQIIITPKITLSRV